MSVSSRILLASSSLPRRISSVTWCTVEPIFVRRFVTSSPPRCASTNQNRNALTHSRDDAAALGPVTLGQKVKETTKDLTYLSIILAGIGVTGIVIYIIYKELFSSQSPNVVYSRTLDRVRADSRVSAETGEPMQGFGELTSRGRRRHVTHLEYIQDGRNMMRMKFYVKGPYKQGTVHLEMQENSSGIFEYRYLFVEFLQPYRKVIILEDNRHSKDENINTTSLGFDLPVLTDK